METLKNKTALITGAGAGIGHAICKTLNNEGANIVAVARNENNLQQLKQELSNNSNQYWALDLGNKEGQTELLKKLEGFGFPHIVVCNIHIRSEKKRLINTLTEDFSKEFTVNINHLFAILEKTLQFQRLENFGRWIGISSFAAHTGLPGQSLYNAQKAAMEALFLNLAAEEGKHGITANTIAPGFIETPSTKKNIPAEMFAKLSAMNITKRAGKPEEIAAAVSFLASPGASFITGINLPVTGGAHLAWNFT